MSNNHFQNKYDAIVIGAGPAGLIVAGRVAELGGKVLLVEKMNQVGRKLLITGKGRCNISNDASQSVYYKNIYPNGRFLKHAFDAFFTSDIVKLLKSQGLDTVVERGDRIFPSTDSSADVLNALLKWVNKNAVSMICQAKVLEIIMEESYVKGVRVLKDGKNIEVFADNVILCTGGKSYPATGSTGDGYQIAQKAGHTIQDVRPSLVPLVTSGNMAANLQGLSLKNVNAIVWVNNKKCKEEFGEMLFAHYGLSGPIILTLSRFVVDELKKKNRVEITIDLKPALDEQKLDARLLRDLEANGKKQIENIFKLWLPHKLIPVFLQENAIDGKKSGHQITAKERRKILLMMKNLKFEITDNLGFKEAIITAGGIDTSEIDPRTMESKLIKNLYFAGEVIDLDANTGGFNLQIAYSTAWLAAEACMKVK